ncbi:MAG: hypothetical protein AB7F86_14175 [Bdellovibrionales bacterium]
MFKLLATSILSIVIVNAGCASKQKLEGRYTTRQPGVVSVWANWVKDKGKKYDLQLAIANDANEPIIVMLGEMACYRGGQRGTLRHTFFNTGERTIDFRPKELKTFNMVCQIGTDAEGDFKIEIGNIYENPTGDGKTTGKTMAQGISWTAPDLRN